MYISLSKKILSVLLAGALLSPVLQAQASESPDSLSVTLEKTVQFPNLEGEEVLVPAGDYLVLAGKEQLTLTGSDSHPIIIEAYEGSHSTELLAPAVVFISSEDDEATKAHLLVLYYPDGKTLEALGSDPAVISRGSMEPTVEDLEFIDPALVTFSQLVHFTATDGSPVVVQPGTYRAEASEKAIRLISDKDSHTTLVIEAQQGTNDTEIDDFLALSFPGTTPKELDFHYLMLLLPNGQSLEATGSYSGIQTRGWLKNTFNKAKKTVNTNYKKVQKTPAFKKVNQAAQQVGKTAQQGAKIVGTGVKQGVSATKWAAGQAGKGIVIGANETWKGMKWAGKQVGTGAKIAACYSTVGAMKAGKAVAQFMTNLVPKGKKNQKDMKDKLSKDAAFRDQIAKKITAGINANQHVIPEMQRIQDWMKNPANKAKLDAIFSTKNFCSDSIGTMDRNLKNLGIAPNFALIQSRGGESPHFYMGYSITIDAGLGVGILGGLTGVTDFKGNGGKYWFLGAQGGIIAGGGGAIQLTFWPTSTLEGFKGPSWGVGGSLGKVGTVNVDVMFDEKFKEFQGFGLGGGAGVGPAKMFGDIAVSWDYSWKYE